MALVELVRRMGFDGCSWLGVVRIVLHQWVELTEAQKRGRQRRGLRLQIGRHKSDSPLRLIGFFYIFIACILFVFSFLFSDFPCTTFCFVPLSHTLSPSLYLFLFSFFLILLFPFVFLFLALYWVFVCAFLFYFLRGVLE